MGLKKIRSEGGTGGKRGHSNMTHWAYTHEIKIAARSRRRADDKLAVREHEDLLRAHASAEPLSGTRASAVLLHSNLMSQPSEVLQAALELAPRERADLVEAIAASLDGFDLGDEWEDEIRKRVRDVDSGDVKPIPGEEVLSRVEQRLRAR